MKIGIVAQEGCFASAVASMIDIFETAEAIRSQIDSSIVAITVEVAASRRSVTGTAGMTINATRTLSELADLDIVIVPALGTITGPTTESALASKAGQRIVGALRTVDPGRARLAAACTGVFTLAETGMLDGRRATTTWFLAQPFRTRFPAVAIDFDAMVVADGPFITAGAAFAHIDLALSILRGVSVNLAHHVARLLLIDERPSQVASVMCDHLDHSDPIVLAFERYVRQNLDQPMEIARAVRAIGTSRRSLERRTRKVLGLSPLDVVRGLRVERAEYLRRTTDLTIDQIATRVGYANAESLRALQRPRSKASSTRTARSP
ncbi:GlxA family transcriptional regulator [Mycobacterium decipiens]|uniref:AraC family transcriptional regulator n=1 Tax=Mycobacterium decipiens TaxID=1430326 RepID=A0A1X2LYD0_9MYCO|nr:helix-turn-helix domain-containing protein [Mycobacterium decipiens]OSC42116.1 AraC family transcriptional regulator [Mycobacterium decipiens]